MYIPLKPLFSRHNGIGVQFTDEPTGNLDPVTAKGIMELLSEINKSGTTVLVVTHNKELVNEMGKRVILIEDGHIEQDEIRGSYDI